MSLLPIILCALALALVLGWLIFLTAKLLSVSRSIDMLPARPAVDRRSVDRIQHEVSDCLEKLQLQRRNADSFERRLRELEQAVPYATQNRGHSETQELQSTAVMVREYPSRIPEPEPAEPKATAFEDELAAAFNAFAAPWDGSARDAFIAKYAPRPMAYQSGQFAEQENGSYWMVPIPEGTHAAILPSGKVTRDWEKLYRAMNGMQAHQALGDVFDVSNGAQLKVEKIALAELSGEHGALIRRGQLSGV